MRSLVTYLANNYLQRVRIGDKEVVALCPFHNDTSPSFFVNLDTGKWFCHGCGAKGHIQNLARRLGVATNVSNLLTRATPQLKPKEEAIHELPTGILGVFDYCPVQLVESGFPEQLLKKHDVGFDQEHRRITFPLWSLDGKLRLISGRTVVDEEPRYLIYLQQHLKNIVELQNYEPQKSNYLWRENLVLPKQDLIICEGFKATLWNVKFALNAVAALGAHLSAFHEQTIRRLEPKRIILMFDNNEAGQWATYRAIPKLLGLSERLVVFKYPNPWLPDQEINDQPDDLTEQELEKGMTNVWSTNEWRAWTDEFFTKQNQQEAWRKKKLFKAV